MLALRKLLNKPKLEDKSLLSLFYYCDIAVNHQMQELNALMRINPDNLDRRATLIRQLKEAQHNLMNVIMSITDKAIPDKRVSRDFRAKYPDDVLVDQINGPIWFGAECIAAGSHIANHEAESIELRPYAVNLSKVVTKVRQALRLRTFVTKQHVFPQKIKDIFVLFDEVWADFEFRYVSLMCTVKTETQYYQQQDVVVLFCESTLRAIKNKYLSYEMIEMMDPSAMFAIPRLSILCGLVVYPDGPLDPSRPSKDMPHYFRAYKQLLCRIKELLGYLNQEQIGVLEKALCSAEGLGTLERNRDRAAAAKKKVQQNRNGINIVPESHSRRHQNTSATMITSSGRPFSENVGRSSRPVTSTSQHLSAPLSQQHRSQSYNLDSRDSNDTVFEPLPVTGTVETPISSSTAVNVLQEEAVEPFPHLGVDQPIHNELPSSHLSVPTVAQSSNSGLSTSTPSLTTVSPSASPNPTSFGSSNALKSPRKTKSKGPGGFPTVEDLMHRLFLGISGVADQLQTNHAKDLRVILKDVFAVCQSEPETTDVVQTLKEHSRDTYSSMDELEPCTPEPQSPLITASQRFTFPTESLTIEQSPSWIPDSDSPVCSICTENFSWRRRRHHCRSCGNVVCAGCSPNNLPLFQYGMKKAVRVCTNCYISQLGTYSRTLVGASMQPLQV